MFLPAIFYTRGSHYQFVNIPSHRAASNIATRISCNQQATLSAHNAMVALFTSISLIAPLFKGFCNFSEAFVKGPVPGEKGRHGSVHSTQVGTKDQSFSEEDFIFSLNLHTRSRSLLYAFFVHLIDSSPYQDRSLHPRVHKPSGNCIHKKLGYERCTAQGTPGGHLAEWFKHACIMHSLLQIRFQVIN